MATLDLQKIHLYGDILNRFCDGKPTIKDIQTLNSRVVTASTQQGPMGNDNLPEGIAYATYYNKERMQSMLAFFTII
jgi:hypothetical protein